MKDVNPNDMPASPNPLNGAGPSPRPASAARRARPADPAHDDAEIGPRNKWASRLVVLFLLLGPLSFGVAAVIMSLRPQPPATQTVVSPFKALDGTWEGEYVTSKGGQVVSSVPMRLEFRHVLAKSDFRQEGHFTFKDPKTDEPRMDRELNKADFKSPKMTRRLVRDNGNDVSLLAGRVEDGKFIWSRSAPNLSEEFTEWIEGDVYHIRGKSVYGDPASAEPTFASADFKRVPQP